MSEFSIRTVSALFAAGIALPFIMLFTYIIYHFTKFIRSWKLIATNTTNKHVKMLGVLILVSDGSLKDIDALELSNARHHFRRFIISAGIFFLCISIFAIINRHG